MNDFTIRLYAQGTGPLRSEQVSAASAGEVASMALTRLQNSRTFTAARVYRGAELVQVVGRSRGSLL